MYTELIGYPLRFVYGLFRKINRDRVAHGALPDPDLATTLHRCVRYYVRRHQDPIAVPLTKGWRTKTYDNGERGTDYRILPEDPDDPWTETQLSDYMHSSDVYYGRGHYDFDCSGERFTRSWSYTRTPCGIVLIHHWGTDI